MLRTIYTDKAPKAIGPYSQGTQFNDIIFLSGQIPVDPATNEVVESDIVVQTHQVMTNIKSILKNEKLTMENIVKTTIFVKNLEQFSIINEVYGSYFGSHRPARSTVEVSRLPKDVLIEIEVIAAKNR
ncbi:RidA family protein [Bacillus timonensis]|uniref:RidA family protein n=1 Tax=Bacillus timonensis TaxID=1033734 RepID=UPI00028A4079|nr:RidA family protein [Bacillus timonensis]